MIGVFELILSSFSGFRRFWFIFWFAYLVRFWMLS